MSFCSMYNPNVDSVCCSYVCSQASGFRPKVEQTDKPTKLAWTMEASARAINAIFLPCTASQLIRGCASHLFPSYKYTGLTVTAALQVHSGMSSTSEKKKNAWTYLPSKSLASITGLMTSEQHTWKAVHVPVRLALCLKIRLKQVGTRLQPRPTVGVDSKFK